MNKKFSTLMAGLLVASTVAANAESLNPSRAYEFRVADVQAAVPFKTVSKIDPNKWYQLRTTEFYGNEALRMPNRPYFGSEVLVHYRDLFTGEVYLRAVPAEEAPLVPSLWRLEYKADGVGGGVWTFINKETGVELTYDPAFANTNTKDGFNSKSALMVRSCTVNWEWYNTDEQNSTFKEIAPYAYIDDGSNEVMIMQRWSSGYIRALKGSKKDLINNDKAVNALKFQPVEATPITLNEYAFNSMIDANKRTWIQDGAFKVETLRERIRSIQAMPSYREVPVTMEELKERFAECMRFMDMVMEYYRTGNGESLTALLYRMEGELTVIFNEAVDTLLRTLDKRDRIIANPRIFMYKAVRNLTGLMRKQNNIRRKLNESYLNNI